MQKQHTDEEILAYVKRAMGALRDARTALEGGKVEPYAGRQGGGGNFTGQIRNPNEPVTDNQIAFLNRQPGAAATIAAKYNGRTIEQLTKGEASAAIDYYKGTAARTATASAAPPAPAYTPPITNDDIPF